MKYLNLNNQIKMPIMGLGTWLSVLGEVYRAVRWAIKIGYRHIDCASIYGNQKEIGQALFDAVREGDIKRSELFITSKLWNDCHRQEDVRPSLKETLSDLQLDYLDLYLMHWPVAQKKGVTMPKKNDDWISLNEVSLSSTWFEMEKLYNDGLVKSIGVSNFNQQMISELIKNNTIVPMVNQIENHPYLKQNKLVNFCQNNNIAVTAYSPLGSQHREVKDRILDDEVIIDIANKINATPAQVVLAWQIQRNIAVIPKSVNEKRLKENFAAQAIVLDAEDVNRINMLNKKCRFIKDNKFLNPQKGYIKIFDD